MKYIFAGDRQISVKILKFIISKGFKPLALFVSSDLKETHANELIKISNLKSKFIFKGKEVNNKKNINILSAFNLDYIIGIHFPYIISEELLKIPKIGFINLHPAYLPYNKGWHTPSWAIIDDTTYGATLHFMSKKLDEGDIIYQEKIDVQIDDTANSLYQKVLVTEFDVFKSTFKMLLNLEPKRIKQIKKGTSHIKKDLKQIQEIDLNKNYNARELINTLRGLTTNNINESAFFIEKGEKYYIKIDIIKGS